MNNRYTTIVNIVQGVAEGVTFPSLHAMTARWVPSEERNSFVARSYFGSTFGLIITYPLCGYFASTLGWESAFYAVGLITLAWYLAWLFLVYDTPEKHPRISPQERQRIRTLLDQEASGSQSAEDMPVPWKSIFTSVPFYGLLITDTANCWGLYTMATNVPSYLKFMLGLDVAAAGFLAALPPFSRYVGGVATAVVADKLLSSHTLSRTNVRRVFNSVSQVGCALSMALVAFSGCDVTTAMVILCIGWFLNGALASSHMVSHVDLSPNFAGTLFGITNTFSGGATSFIVTFTASLTKNI